MIFPVWVVGCGCVGCGGHGDVAVDDATLVLGLL